MSNNGLLNVMRGEAQKALQGVATTRLGTISSYDASTHAVKVLLQPDGTETGWCPLGETWVGNGWGMFCAPSIGDQVQVEFQEGDKSVGIACLRFYNDVDRPLSVPSGEMWIVTESGSFLKFKKNGTIESNAPNWNHTGNLNVTGNVAVTGTETVQGTITGQNGLVVTGSTPSTVSGGFSVTGGDITSDGVSLESHTHSGVQTGGGTSGPPGVGSGGGGGGSLMAMAIGTNSSILAISGVDPEITPEIFIDPVPAAQYFVLMGNGPEAEPTYQAIPLAALPSSLATTTAVTSLISGAIAAALVGYASSSSLSGYATTSALSAAIATIPAASSATPLMDGAAAVGSSPNFAHGDHVHPTDTSRAAVSDIPLAANATPLNNATTGVIGTSTRYARQDHVHPTTPGNVQPIAAVQTANLTLTLAHRTVPFDCTSGALTASLPISPPIGTICCVGKVDNSANDLTLSGNGALINRELSITLSSRDTIVTVQWQPELTWLVIGKI